MPKLRGVQKKKFGVRCGRPQTCWVFDFGFWVCGGVVSYDSVDPKVCLGFWVSRGGDARTKPHDNCCALKIPR
jgi:hypothetical protein